MSFLGCLFSAGASFLELLWKKIENRYVYNFLKSSHFAIIWAFWVTNLGSNTPQERKIVYFRNNLSAKTIAKSTWTMSLLVFMESKYLICDRNNQISAVPLDVALERRTKRCSPEISARLSLLDQRFWYLSPGSEGEKSRPLDHMWEIPFIHLDRVAIICIQGKRKNERAERMRKVLPLK